MPLRIERKGELIEVLYTKQEFEELLVEAATASVRFAKKLCPAAIFPDDLLFLLPVSEPDQIDRTTDELIVTSDRICDASGAVGVLLREDGWHLSDIHLGVYAVSESKTLIRIDWSIYGWTNKVLVGHPLFPNPPFIIAGPVLQSYEGQTGTGRPTVYKLIVKPNK